VKHRRLDARWRRALVMSRAVSALAAMTSTFSGRSCFSWVISQSMRGSISVQCGGRLPVFA
jgi:hypothetical protein